MISLKHSLVLSGLLFSVAQPCVAQTAQERAGARAAAIQAIQAYEEGRWDETIELMTRAERLIHAPTHLLYLARARAKLGQLVAAHEIYVQLVREQLPSNAPEAFVAAKADAEKEADALVPRLAQLKIVVEGKVSGGASVVTMDETRVPEALVDVVHPVDPGTHRLRAKADGLESDLATIILAEGARETVVLKLHASPSSPAAVPDVQASKAGGSTATAAAEEGGGTAAPDSAKSLAAPGMHPLTVVGIVGVGVGAVGLGLGTLFVVQASGKRSDADAEYELCKARSGTGTCPTANRAPIDELQSSARSKDRWAAVGLVGGGISLAAGLSLLIWGPSGSRKSAATLVQPYVADRELGVVGQF